MSETSRWRPISGGARPRMFGLYREPDRTRAVSCKLLVLLGVLASSALAVCFVSLMLTKTTFSEFIEEPQQNSSSRIQSTKIPLPPNVTAPGDGVQETLSRPSQNDFPTVNYPPVVISQEEKTVLEATTGIQGPAEPRSVREYIESVRMGRILNRKRPSDQVGAAYSQLPSYGDEYAQLEGYRTPPRGVQEVMSWVESPAVKFAGVYVKAEDKPFLNGHAYVSDPFVRFKPSHPSEINQLAVETERGTRFSNRPNPQPVPLHTQAIFHPMMRPRPLKIMLDVYPMVPEPSSGPSISGFTEYRGRPQKLQKGSPPNRMIIHLNLYPKKTSQLSRRRPGLLEEESVQERIDEEPFEEEEAHTVNTTEIDGLDFETTTERTEQKLK